MTSSSPAALQRDTRGGSLGGEVRRVAVGLWNCSISQLKLLLLYFQISFQVPNYQQPNQTNSKPQVSLSIHSPTALPSDILLHHLVQIILYPFNVFLVLNNTFSFDSVFPSFSFSDFPSVESLDITDQGLIFSGQFVGI